MTAHVIRAGAEHLPLPDNTVDLIVTSPPYFGLRSYQDGGRHYDGQVGSEPTPGEFLDVLVACTREWVRVVKPSGSIWVNLGDKYAGSGMGGNTSLANSDSYLEQRAKGYHPCPDPNATTDATAAAPDGSTVPVLNATTSADARTAPSSGRRKDLGGIRSKSLMGLPWRYAIRCIDELGLILRAEVVWSKPNGLPESVTDRVRRSHEQWFHFTLSPRYFSAVDEIREQHAPGTHQRRLDGQPSPKQAAGLANGTRRGYMPETYTNPLGKLPGSVWTVPTEPLSLPDVSPLDGRPLPDHFAAFPMEWPRRIIQGWSPPGICPDCGGGVCPVTEKPAGGKAYSGGNTAKYEDWAKQNRGAWQAGVTRRIVGYVCPCGDRFREPNLWGGMLTVVPSVVLDPFGGTGTTALVASALNRTGISVDLSHDYCRLARWRTSDRGQVAKAMQVERPEPVMDGQGNLFGEETAGPAA